MFLPLRRCLGLVWHYVSNHWAHTNNLPGHGTHACPGRFLAGNELKIALAHLLLKYDWKLDDSDTMPKFILQELAHSTTPDMKLMLKRRKEEINLDIDMDLLNVED